MPPPGDRRVKAVVFDVGGILEPPFGDVLVPELAATLGLSRARLAEHRAASAVALTEGRRFSEELAHLVSLGADR